MAVDYDEIRRIHRLEKAASNLVKLPDDFYSDLSSFLSDAKESYLESLKDFSPAKARDFVNLKKMVEEIFLLREKKILTKALIASRTKEYSVEEFALQEKKFFEKMLSVLESHNEILDGFFSERQAKKQKDLNIVSVKVLSEIPSFVGADMKDYGPFSPGQTASVPFAVAKLLVARGLVSESE